MPTHRLRGRLSFVPTDPLDPDLVLPSPLSRVPLPFRELARRLAPEGLRALAETRLALALEIQRDPAPQELWDHFRLLHTALAAEAHKRTSQAQSGPRPQPRPNPYADELPAHLDEATLPRFALDAAVAREARALVHANSLDILQALKVLRRPKPPKG